MYSMIPKPTNVSSILFEIQELEIDTDLAQICFPSHSGFRSYQRIGTACFFCQKGFNTIKNRFKEY